MKDSGIHKVIIPVAIIVTAIIVVAVISAVRMSKASAENRTIVKENVRVISDEDESIQLALVEADKLIFKEKPQYTTGDVIVAGIIDTAPNGFIRKVVNVTYENNQYVVETENGYLTDVFEEVHISKTFILTEDGANEAEQDRMAYVNRTATLLCAGLLVSNMENSEENTSKEIGYTLTEEVTYEVNDDISVSGELTCSICLEVTLDIEHGEVVLEMIARNENMGALSLACNTSDEESFSKMLITKELPSIQFWAGTVPVVITNELSATVDGNVGIEGDLSTSVELSSECAAGFRYDSVTGKLVEIKEKNYFSDGITWDVEAEVKGEAALGVFIHLTSKFYDLTGANLALGVEGRIGAEVCNHLVITEGTYELVGAVDMSVVPVFKGNVVVDVPVVDERLLEEELFKVDLPALWEKRWESSANWQLELVEVQAEEENGIDIDSNITSGNQTQEGECVFNESTVLDDIYINEREIDIEAQQIILNAESYNTIDKLFSIEDYYNDPSPFYLSEDDYRAYEFIYTDLHMKIDWKEVRDFRRLYMNIDGLFRDCPSEYEYGNLESMVYNFYDNLLTDYDQAMTDFEDSFRHAFRYGGQYYASGEFIYISDIIMYAPYYLREAQRYPEIPTCVGMYTMLERMCSVNREDTCNVRLPHKDIWSERDFTEEEYEQYTYENIGECIPFVETLVYMGAKYDSFVGLSEHSFTFSSPIIVPSDYYCFDWFDGRVESAYIVPFWDRTADLYGIAWYDNTRSLIGITFGLD